VILNDSAVMSCVRAASESGSKHPLPLNPRAKNFPDYDLLSLSARKNRTNPIVKVNGWAGDAVVFNCEFGI
jgi:hypothetical protein